MLWGNLVGPQKRLSRMSKFSLAGERKKEKNFRIKRKVSRQASFKVILDGLVLIHVLYFHWLNEVGSRGHQLYRKEVALANIPVKTNLADTG